MGIKFLFGFEGKIMKAVRVVYLSILFCFTSSVFSAGSVEWGYEGSIGPDFWGDLSPGFLTCKVGLAQSPIDIMQAVETDELSPIGFSYNETPLVVKNNGHTIEVEYEPGSTIDLDGEEYRLLQFHFHTPSEHTKNGKLFPMEVHLVHANEQGELAVVGAFMKDTKKKNNAFFQDILDNAPEVPGVVDVHGSSINVDEFLPANREYWNYSGSLTTPPCSEGVRWFVLKGKIKVSQNQVSEFEQFFHLNARPTQPLNGRVVNELDD